MYKKVSIGQYGISRGDKMRTNLKIFRVKNSMSQTEISEKLGCSRATYAAIECGVRNGRLDFWLNLQETFSLPNTDMWDLMKNE